MYGRARSNAPQKDSFFVEQASCLFIKYSLSQLGEVQGNGASGIGHRASGIGHRALPITNYLLPILDRTSSF
ncbi:hypothetical protein [Tychonema bourrellyi]|uniref:hypothetical protein n=1 Tax=Tychonema bourrellyi TaxID=54313 RepID=UPI0015D4A14C|nr:hypothetical protein [Tychonema bourrellyi]